jgi:nucleotide-binding universal stress UspA family protein
MNELRGGRVVVGVGESLSALRALRSAVAEARRRDTVLRAVRAWHLDSRMDAIQYYAGQADMSANAVDTIVQSFDRAMGGLPRDIRFELVAVDGAIGPTLVAQADSEDDLLVLGSPVHRWWSPARYSVIRYCARHAACPVLVVPAPRLAGASGVKASARAMRRELRRLVETAEPR